MKVGDLVKCKYSFDKLMGVILETRKIKSSLAIKVWRPDRPASWSRSTEYEVINE